MTLVKNIEKSEVKQAPAKGTVFLTFSTKTMEVKTSKCNISDLKEIIKDKPTAFERIWGPVIPYFDFDIKDAKEEDKNDYVKDIVIALKIAYPGSYIFLFDGSRMKDGKFKFSLHAIVRNAGYYASGVHLEASLPNIIRELPGLDTGVYKEADKSQLFKFPYCRKPEEKNAPVMKMCNFDEETGLVPVEFEDCDESFFKAFCITNISKEQLVEVDLTKPEEKQMHKEEKEKEEKHGPQEEKYPPPTREDIEKWVDMLKASRATPHDDRIRVIWCLRNIQEQYDIDTYEFAEKFYRKDLNEWADGGQRKLGQWFWGAVKDGLGVGSLRMWGKEDSPAEYERMMQEKYAVTPIMAEEIKDGYYNQGFKQIKALAEQCKLTVKDVKIWMMGCIRKVGAGNIQHFLRVYDSENKTSSWDMCVDKHPFAGVVEDFKFSVPNPA